VIMDAIVRLRLRLLAFILVGGTCLAAVSEYAGLFSPYPWKGFAMFALGTAFGWVLART
jgi:1,4-dihydroxy-2-naphthoate octaprenyltransferase